MVDRSRENEGTPAQSLRVGHARQRGSAPRIISSGLLSRADNQKLELQDDTFLGPMQGREGEIRDLILAKSS
jgi:hypothetical protein